MTTKAELQERLQFLVDQNIQLRRHNIAAQTIATSIYDVVNNYKDIHTREEALRGMAECLRDLMDTACQSGEQVNVIKEGGVVIGLQKAAWLIDHGTMEKWSVVSTLTDIALRQLNAKRTALELGLALDPAISRETMDLLGT